MLPRTMALGPLAAPTVALRAVFHAPARRPVCAAGAAGGFTAADSTAAAAGGGLPLAQAVYDCVNSAPSLDNTPGATLG